MSSITQERKVICYPSPKYEALFRAYAALNEMSKSAAGAEAIKQLIDNLPPDQKMKVINAAKQINGSKNSY